MALEPKKRTFTVAEYHQMGRAGILGEDDRVELIDGEVMEMAAIGHRHFVCVTRLSRLFFRSLDDVAVVSVQNPIRLDDRSEPLPDLALLRPGADSYDSEPSVPADVFLLVEVADSSADFDRRVKMPLYARSGIPEAWLVDLEQRTITVYLDPTPNGYRTAPVFRREERVAPSAFPGRAIAISDILPE